MKFSVSSKGFIHETEFFLEKGFKGVVNNKRNYNMLSFYKTNQEFPDTSYDNLDTSMFNEGECTIHPINNQIFFVTVEVEEGDADTTKVFAFSHGKSICLGEHESHSENEQQGFVFNCCSGWENIPFAEWERKMNKILFLLSNGLFGEE